MPRRAVASSRVGGRCAPPGAPSTRASSPTRLLQLLAEIKIHKSLQHRYIVGFQSYFEDRANVYIMLELCGSQVRVWGAALGREGGSLNGRGR